MRLYDPIGGEHMNVLKAGLECAHRLVAVSLGYAWECQTPVRWVLVGGLLYHSANGLGATAGGWM